MTPSYDRTDPAAGTPSAPGPAPRSAVISDSAASLPADVAETLGVHLVPMSLVLGGTRYEDGSITPEEVLQRAAAGHEKLSTSAPSPGEFLKVIDEARDDGFERFLVVTVSSHMSGSFDAATIAARYLPGSTVAVLDSGTAAGSQGLVALAAARRAALGASLDDVAEVARRAASSVMLTASIEDLGYLARSGRVPGIAAWAGRTAGVRPLFSFDHGKVRPRRPALSTRGVVEHLLADCARSRPAGPARLHAAVLTSGADDAAGVLYRSVHSLLAGETGKTEDAEDAGDAEVFVAPFSSVMVAHTGPGLLGLGWWWEPTGPEGPDRTETGRLAAWPPRR